MQRISELNNRKSKPLAACICLDRPADRAIFLVITTVHVTQSESKKEDARPPLGTSNPRNSTCMTVDDASEKF